MRLLVLCEFPLLLGGDRSLLAVLPGLRQRGWDITVVAPPHGPLARALAAQRVRHRPWTLLDPQGKRRPLSALRQELLSTIRDLQPDLLHANSLAMGRISGPVVRQAKLPGVAHLRDIVRLNRRQCEDLACHTRLIAVSRAVRDAHLANGLPPAKIVVVTNGIAAETFPAASGRGHLHRELGLDVSQPLVGSIGQISLRKAPDVLVEVAAHVATEFPDVHFVHAGDCLSQKQETVRLAEECRRQTERGELRGRFHWLGIREDVPQLLPELACLVHTARQEPLGRVLLEAAMAGTPIVATAVGGTSEILPTEEVGILTAADDVAGLSRGVLQLLNDPLRRRRQAEAARSLVARTFALEPATDRLAAVLRDATS